MMQLKPHSRSKEVVQQRAAKFEGLSQISASWTSWLLFAGMD